MQETVNEAITLLLLPDRHLPILLPSRGGKAEGQIFYSQRDERGHKHVKSLGVVTASRAKELGDPNELPAEFGARLKYILALDRAAQARDKRQVKQLLRDGIKKGFHTWETLFDPARLLGATLNTGLHGIIFVVWWSNKHKKLIPGLYCPNRQTAWYALALQQVGTPGGIGICPCGKVFIRRKADHDYHSPRCRAAAGMRRLRARRSGQATRFKLLTGKYSPD